MSEKEYGYDPVETDSPYEYNQQSYREEKGQLWRQYVIGSIENLSILALGYCMVWTSPAITMLRDPKQSPLLEPITTDQESWIGSLLTIGAFFGSLCGGPISATIGRKWASLSSSIPLLLGWLFVLAASGIGHLYAARMLWGFGTGILYTSSPMYCAEIATDDGRGVMGSFLQVYIVIGFLMAYVVGPYTDYFIMAYVGMACLVVFVATFIFMPESPMYHLTKNNRDKAAACLATIRGRSRAGIEGELNKMAAEIDASNQKKGTIADVFRGSNFKAFYISVSVIIFQQVCGITALLFYLTTIFEAAGTNLDSSLATIIIGTVQMLASFITPLVVYKLGRRTLLLISSAGTAVGLFTLGLFFFLDSQGNPITKSLGFVPVASLVLFIITYCWGLGPLPWAILGELFPMEVKSAASSLATACCWVMSFLVTRYFGPVAQAVGMHVAFWIFSVCCVFSFLFSMFVLPETKGKSFQEIQDMLGARTSKSGLA